MAWLIQTVLDKTIQLFRSTDRSRTPHIDLFHLVRSICLHSLTSLSKSMLSSDRFTLLFRRLGCIVLDTRSGHLLDLCRVS